MQKKILLVVPLSTHKWGTKNFGGVDSVCQILIQYLQKKPNLDYQYRIIGFNPLNDTHEDGKMVNIASNIELIIYNQNYITKLPGIPFQLFRLNKHIREFSPDLIHTHNSVWALANLKKLPQLATIHSYKKITRASSSFLNNLFYEKILPIINQKYITGYTVVGDLLLNAVKEDVSQTVEIVYNPIIPEYFPPPP